MPLDSGPVGAKGAWRLRSWCSQVELGFETDNSISLTIPAESIMDPGTGSNKKIMLSASDAEGLAADK